MDVNDWGDEDYIDIELISTNSSPPDFEFQMSLTCNNKETAISPADDLFYKGKLLPLYLPPRLLHDTIFEGTGEEVFDEDEYFIMPMPFTDYSTVPCANTLLESCQLYPDDYFLELPTEYIDNHPTKMTWSTKLKVFKQTIFSEKLKASRAFLKSLFRKSACSDESCAKASCNTGPKVDQSLDKCFKISKRKQLRLIGSTPASVMKQIEDIPHRRSFSSVIKHCSPSSSISSSGASSSSSSFSLRRTSSATELDGSIEAAIAHCKKSH